MNEYYEKNKRLFETLLVCSKDFWILNEDKLREQLYSLNIDITEYLKRVKIILKENRLSLKADIMILANLLDIEERDIKADSEYIEKYLRHMEVYTKINDMQDITYLLSKSEFNFDFGNKRVTIKDNCEDCGKDCGKDCGIFYRVEGVERKQDFITSVLRAIQDWKLGDKESFDYACLINRQGLSLREVYFKIKRLKKRLNNRELVRLLLLYLKESNNERVYNILFMLNDKILELDKTFEVLLKSDCFESDDMLKIILG